MVTDALLARAAMLSSATLHEAAARTGALPHALKPLCRSMRFAGRALPVRCPAGDNLQIHHALAAARPNDVLVVDTGQGTGFGYWGEIMATAAIVRDVAALVITGGVRDSTALIELGLPTFCAAIAICGTGKDGRRDGAVGDSVRIGDIVVRLGDLVVGDADGVFACAAEVAEAAVAAAEHRDAEEVAILEKIRNGAPTLQVYGL